MTAADHGLGSWIRRRAAAAPNDIAITQGSLQRTYGEMDRRVRNIRAFLNARGLEPGARVAYHGPNHPVALDLLFATLSSGAVWVPVLSGRTADEITHILRDSGSTLLVSSESAPEGIEVVSIEALDEAADINAQPGEIDVALEDLAILGYTSGTTGPPKGAMLTHANLTWNVLNMMSACSFGADDRTLALAPFTRLGGLGVLVLETFFCGGTIVIPDGSRSLLETITQERITHLFANPAPLAELASDDAWDGADLSSVKVGIVGGSMVPEGLLRTFLDRGVPLRHGYGLTEAAPGVTLLDERDAVRKFGSVGKPIGLVDLAIDAAPGDAGEILVRGPNVISRYWNREEGRTAGGWWHTGDAGRVDEEGFVYILDRMSDRIRIGQRSIFPSQVEQALHADPAIDDAAVTGDDDGLLIYVAADPAFPREAAPIVLPDAISDIPFEVRRVDSIPRNASGKILRDELRGRS